MRMESLAYASIRQFSKVSLRLENCEVKALHRYEMLPISVERFVYITQGEVCFYLGSQKVMAKSRDMVYLPRDTSYQSQWFCESRFVVVDLSLCDEEGNDIRFGDRPGVLFNDANQIYDGLLAELGKKAETVGPFDWLERLHLSFKLLCEMARDTTMNESNKDYNLIKKGVLYLENNCTEKFSIGELAEMCALSPDYFRKLFIACKGTTPSDYRNRLRIQRACEMLRGGNYTVGEVAEQVGVNDIKYFSKLFIKYTGLKPSDFKKGTVIQR